MSKLLYLQTSPRGERSYSTTVADAFIESYCEAHREDEKQLLVHVMHIRTGKA